MKSFKNKILHSLSEGEKSIDAEYNSLKKYSDDLIHQQKLIYQNLLKQEPVLQQLSLSSFCDVVKESGCENDPHIELYSSCVKNVDRIIAEHEV